MYFSKRMHFQEIISKRDKTHEFLGPYYLKDVTKLTAPHVLPMRVTSRGTYCSYGTIRDIDGNPLANTTVDMWQADASGAYSGFAEGIPTENLRGVFQTDADGNFEVQTVIPGDYSIPTNGPTGQFLEWIDSHPTRPADLSTLLI